jgi:hypothetical protein
METEKDPRTKAPARDEVSDDAVFRIRMNVRGPIAR